MPETLYAERPDVYDALYAEKDYGGETEFVVSKFETHAETDRRRALIVGCGTGEHGGRLADAGFEVVGVDKYPAMVERARAKSEAAGLDAEFRRGELPDLAPSDLHPSGAFDLVWLPFTVVQHLPPDDLAPSLQVLVDALAPGGLLVFDQLPMDEEPFVPRLSTYSSEASTFARLTQVREVDDTKRAVAAAYRYEALVFTPDSEFFVDTHRLFDHDPTYLRGVCDALGLSLAAFDWYDDAESDEGGPTTFVAT